MNTPKIGIPYDRITPFISTSNLTYTANVVRAVLFEVPGFSVTVANVLWRLNLAQAASHVGFGIYAVTPGSLTRGARLADTGPVSSAAGTLMISPFLAAVTLPCGIYCMAFTTDNALVQINGTAVSGAFSTGVSVFNAAPEGFIGTAANASAAGQLPATLGLITTSNALSFPNIMLSN